MPHKNTTDRKAYFKDYRARNPDKIAEHNRRAQLKRKYGITPEEYDSLAESQGHRCAICRTDNPGGGPTRRGYWHVDHDHGTGAIRGLLCMDCNVGLGRLGDSVEGLERALAYLRSANGGHPAE